MMNYIKSECYRVSHSKGIYAVTGTLAALSFLFHLVLWWFRRMDGPSFRYGTTSYSYSNLVGYPMVYCMLAVIIGMVLYEENRKNGNLKNTVAFGISRVKIFAGECMVATVSCVFALIVTLSVYLISAALLLEQSGPVSRMDLLTEIPAVFFVAIASLITGIVCMEAFEKSAAGVVIWFTIWFVIPKIFFYLGLRFDAAYDIAMWMPANFFSTREMIVNTKECITIWETGAGMTRCMISGIIGIVIFALTGTALLRKKEF